MAQCRDLENHHHEKLLEISINTLEKIAKGEFDEDLPDDVRSVSTAVGLGRAGWGWSSSNTGRCTTDVVRPTSVAPLNLNISRSLSFLICKRRPLKGGGQMK